LSELDVAGPSVCVQEQDEHQVDHDNESEVQPRQHIPLVCKCLEPQGMAPNSRLPLHLDREFTDSAYKAFHLFLLTDLVTEVRDLLSCLRSQVLDKLWNLELLMHDIVIFVYQFNPSDIIIIEIGRHVELEQLQLCHKLLGLKVFELLVDLVLVGEHWYLWRLLIFFDFIFGRLDAYFDQESLNG
jgi:hypothetical protein